MSTENYGLAVACFQVYYGITKYTQYNISYAYIYESYLLVLRDSSVCRRLSAASACSPVGKHEALQVSPTMISRNVVILACDN